MTTIPDRKITVAQVPSLLLVQEMRNHSVLKPKIISAIEEAGVHPLSTSEEKISNTDWHMGTDFSRKYIDHIKDGVMEVCEYTKSFFKYNEHLEPMNYWYQVYNRGDYHNWHIHPRCLFSNVYYVSLPDGASKTTFRLGDAEFSIDVKEGDVLTFPSHKIGRAHV